MLLAGHGAQGHKMINLRAQNLVSLSDLQNFFNVHSTVVYNN